MNFKTSIQIIFSSVVFSSFATYNPPFKEVTYNSQGLRTITKTIFHKNFNTERFCFLEGFSQYCKEQSIQEGIVIAQISKGRACEGDHNDYCKNTHLVFKHPAFPQTVTFVFTEKCYGIVLKRSLKMSPVMKKFVHDMIEKGKSVN